MLFSVSRWALTLVLAATCLATSLIQAGPITWQTPVTISADTDVSLQGAFIRAAHITTFSPNDATVNTVLFKGWLQSGAFPGSGQTSTQDNSTIDTAPTYTLFGDDRTFAMGVPPSSNLSASYKTTIATAVTNFGPNPFPPGPLTLTLGNLTNGQQYLFQAWMNESAANPGNSRVYQLTSGNTSDPVDANVSGLAGGVGQYVIGTFTADNTGSQLITWSATSGDYLFLNAYQLRAIPEPSSIALLGLGALGLVRIFRRRRDV